MTEVQPAERDEVEMAYEALVQHWPRLRAATFLTSGIIRARRACKARSALIPGDLCAYPRRLRL
jgi:hypothetical protein